MLPGRGVVVTGSSLALAEFAVSAPGVVDAWTKEQTGTQLASRRRHAETRRCSKGRHIVSLHEGALQLHRSVPWQKAVDARILLHHFAPCHNAQTHSRVLWDNALYRMAMMQYQLSPAEDQLV